VEGPLGPEIPIEGKTNDLLAAGSILAAPGLRNPTQVRSDPVGRGTVKFSSREGGYPNEVKLSAKPLGAMIKKKSRAVVRYEPA
jgi:hypothetical protein